MLALHVHHGLSSHADAWLSACEERCRHWAARGWPLAFVAQRLTGRPAPGESVEGWARRERYRALTQMARAGGADLVLIAHHRRDQAETFLLQALRGGGVAALSAMPASATREGVTWARPWLAVPDAVVAAYARAHRLRWVEDDSNADERFARNRLRAQVWPALSAAFPDAEHALARAAAWAQQAMTVVDEVAAHDLLEVRDGDALAIGPWALLPPDRRAHALRAWLHGRMGEPAPSSLVERLLVELDATASRRWPAPEGELHAYRGRLSFVAAPVAPAPGPALPIDLSQPGRHELPSWRGAFHVEPVDAGGMTLQRAAQLQVRMRRPGDRFQAGPGRPPRSLKLQFQAAGVPPRQRTGPVLCSGEVLVFVPGLGIDARVLAEAGDAQVAIAWLPA